MADLRTLAQALADAGRAMDDPGPQGGLEGTLEAIAQTARDAVPGFDHVGVSVVRGDGTVTTMASTGKLVRDMDTLQYELDQGPCLDAMRRDALVLVEDLPTHAQNWPTYAPRASEAGVRAQMGVPLHSNDETLGGLNFYSTAGDTIHSGAPQRAELFATHAAIALAQARHVDVSEAVAAHHYIRQAVGILMERLQITEDRAMYYLVRVATVAELKIQDVAREIVHEATRRHS
jgi:GAF domain-containing protein